MKFTQTFSDWAEVLQKAIPAKPERSGRLLQGLSPYWSSHGGSALDGELVRVFSRKDFEQVGLSSCLPKMCRGLPRLYHRDFPVKSQVKREFGHLPALRVRGALKGIYSVYEGIARRGKVVLLAWVMDERIGDVFLALEMMRLLKEAMPQVETRLVALVEKGVQTMLPEGTSVVVSQEDASPGNLPREALYFLRSADLIVHMPCPWPQISDLMQTLEGIEWAKPCPKIESIGTYGFGESIWCHPRAEACSLGLHGLEQGILTPPLKTTAIFPKRFVEWRQAGNPYHYASLTSLEGGSLYLQSLLFAHRESDRAIDLCTPDLRWFLQMYEKRQPLIRPEMNVRSVELFYGDKHYVLPVASKGKALRILQCAEEKEALLLQSEGFAAVDDNSLLSHVLGAGLPFFYDAPPHARYFIKDLLALAENRLRKYPDLLRVLRSNAQGLFSLWPEPVGEWVDETYFQEAPVEEKLVKILGEALEGAREGFLQLSHIVKSEYSAGSFLRHLVERGLCHAHNPQWAKLEAEAVKEFGQGMLGFPDLIQALRALI